VFVMIARGIYFVREVWGGMQWMNLIAAFLWVQNDS
jgi:hypothetical protein